MSTEPTFIRLLKDDMARFLEMAAHWDKLEKEGVLRFEDMEGDVTSPGEMAAKYRSRAAELRDLIAKLQSKAQQ